MITTANGNSTFRECEMSELMMVYMTTPDLACAEKIGRILIEERLAACVNLLPGMISLYVWAGEPQRETEVMLIAKTRSEHFAALRQRVREIHPYTCPCIVGWPLAVADAAFAQWIAEQTAS